MNIDPQIIEAQRAAINPQHSVWLAASAGSGKTKVLTDRLVNLLLSDTDPAKILCLTFTKAAASVMSNRITALLKKWAIIDTEELCDELTNLRGIPPSNALILKARRLFADVLEIPGGMRIMTIHAFCQSILKRFPIEAGITPQFEVIEEAQSTALMRQAFDEVIRNDAFQNHLEEISDYFQADDMQKVFGAVLQDFSTFEQLFQANPDMEEIQNTLKKKYNLTKYLSEKDIIFEYVNTYFSDTQEDPVSLFENLENGFLTSGTLRDKMKMNDTAVAYFEAYEKRNLFQSVHFTGPLLAFIGQIIKKYNFYKKKQGVLDYTDLIKKTQNLLDNKTSAQWVMYKLDGGIDHILVDEAQDTNPDQWKIIRLLSEEFFSGLGRETDVVRTIFVVGDKKQSIYSFQGADPRVFEEMKLYFQKKITDARQTFKVIPLNASFRSTPEVLHLVNKVLKHPKAVQGVLNVGEEAPHRSANRQKEAGLIEIWPPVTAKRIREKVSWPLLEKQKSQISVVMLAEQIANKIKSFFDNGECFIDAKTQTKVPIQPKDITILVRNRSSIMNELVRALKERRIPVAGVDRLNLSDHIAILDLIALAKFALLPEDNLNLAALLKSPFIGLKEQELMDLCAWRGDKTLWEEVCLKAPVVADKLKECLNLADKVPTYEFFATVLGVLKGRQKLIRRLGIEAMEAVDEFLNLTLSFEEDTTPSLQNFITWFEERTSSIKRDMEQENQNAVKIITVHGSKGLENKIIFIADHQNKKTNGPIFLWEDGIPLWVPRAQHYKNGALKPLLEAFHSKAEEEEHRLLYVALTRARDRLYICGWNNTQTKTLKPGEELKLAKAKSDKKEKEAKTWHQLVTKSVETPSIDETGIIAFPAQATVVSSDQPSDLKENPLTLPAWVNQTAPAETELSKPLMPSRLTENEPQTVSLSGIGREKALKRGTFIHKLLQYLPDVPEQERREKALKLKPQDIDLPEDVFDIFKNEMFQTIFGASSKAEVPVVGIVGDKVFSGQIDRLVVLENEVWIIDYKTNKTPPLETADVHKSYKMQLSAYKNLIKKIFPDKMIRTFLLWTENMNLMEMTSETNLFD